MTDTLIIWPLRYNSAEALLSRSYAMLDAAVEILS